MRERDRPEEQGSRVRSQVWAAVESVDERTIDPFVVRGECEVFHDSAVALKGENEMFLFPARHRGSFSFGKFSKKFQGLVKKPRR
jgi:hypothetical protein